MKILALNGGSSSFKAGLFEFGDAVPRPIWNVNADSVEEVIERVPGGIDAIGHRIVHGGSKFRETTRITPQVKCELGQLVVLAPEHNRLEIQAIDAMERRFGPKMPQVAVFDTAFHNALAPAAYVYPGPYCWLERGIRRYGFHGISHQYVSRRAAELLGRDLGSLRLITCHLGNGCSLAAVRDGRSVDTTMGFTPLDGLMMGTRSGAVDPGILIHLARHWKQSPDELDRMLNQESGLKGISGVSRDMREIVAAMESGNDRARLAFDVFAHRLCREIGAMLPSLGGLDALVFTAGIGENSAPVRAAVADAFAFMGVKLDSRNCEPDCDIAAPDSAIRVLVIRTREEQEIASEVYRNLA